MLNEKKAIYEIFRACRLCGAGGGYKMPIIANHDMDIELRQKIKDCVQIEVRFSAIRYHLKLSIGPLYILSSVNVRCQYYFSNFIGHVAKLQPSYHCLIKYSI